MTQQEFTKDMEEVLSWMRSVNQRLADNDNTHGPLQALEARLRETTIIYQSRAEGLVKMDKALVAAERLLQSGNEEPKNLTQANIKEMKTQWEETCTHITNCHSRIEWVWLHWSEYLKAFEEFELWLMRHQRSLDVALELQLGVKEKQWQVDQQRVVVSDIHAMAAMLGRLLSEAADLHCRTQDPSLDSQTQQRLQKVYSDVKDGAEERLSKLQKITEEHQTFKDYVHKFQTWLLSKTKELSVLMERDHTNQDKLTALQTFDVSIASEEKTLQHIEGLAEAVRASTSPAGAELVVEEAEEIRLGWHRLRQGLCEAEEGLRACLKSHSEYTARCERLEEDIAHLRKLLHELDQEVVEVQESRDPDEETEEEALDNWKRCLKVKSSLSGEESKVELLKEQLKELFRFSEDSHHLSDDVLAVVREHQSVKCKATRLCAESECVLRNIFQDPLLAFTRWSKSVSHVLETSAEVTDFSDIAKFVQSIERLLRQSVQLQDGLGLLRLKGDLLESLFGSEKADALQGELGVAIKNRELLHNQLQQRRCRLEVLITRTKDFGDAHELIRSRLASLEDRLVLADVLQPDILAKKSQSDQFRAIQKELDDCDAQIKALNNLISSSPNNKAQYDKVCIDWNLFHQRVKAKVRESEDNIAAHEAFQESLLNVEKWLKIMKQKLETFHNSSGEWNIDGRHAEVEKAFGEFPEKELQLQQVEVQGQGVLEKTSKEGQVHIKRDMKRLKESWLKLNNNSLCLHRLLSSSTEQMESHFPKVKPLGAAQAEWMSGFTEGDLSLSAVDKPPVLHKVVEKTVECLKADEVDLSAGSRTTADSANGSQHIRETRPATLFIQESFGQWGLISSFEETPESKELPNYPRDQILIREDSADQTTSATANDHIEGLGSSRRSCFEAWLSEENAQLSEILSSKGSTVSTKDMRGAEEQLTALRSRVGSGQQEFELLLQESEGISGGSARDEGLEDLRYRWMLYKSKLKDSGTIRQRSSAKKAAVKQRDTDVTDGIRKKAAVKQRDTDVTDGIQKKAAVKQRDTDVTDDIQKKPGLVQRVCRLAIPLCLLLFALLLLLLVLLPLVGEGSSCSVSNNFARSFNPMLRYQGPPPT